MVKTKSYLIIIAFIVAHFGLCFAQVSEQSDQIKVKVSKLRDDSGTVESYLKREFATLPRVKVLTETEFDADIHIYYWLTEAEAIDAYIGQIMVFESIDPLDIHAVFMIAVLHDSLFFEMAAVDTNIYNENLAELFRLSRRVVIDAGFGGEHLLRFSCFTSFGSDMSQSKLHDVIKEKVAHIDLEVIEKMREKKPGSRFNPDDYR